MIEFTTQNTREHIAYLLNGVIETVLNPSGDDVEASQLLAKATALMDGLVLANDTQPGSRNAFSTPRKGA